MEQVIRHLRIFLQNSSRTLRARRIRVSLILFLSATAAIAQSGASEYQVKAAFLLHFTRFVEWPSGTFADASTPFTICILGDDPFGGALDQVIEGEAVENRKIVIQRIKRVPEPRSCQILFISKSEKNAAGVMSELGQGVLTVGEHSGFLREGGIVEFALEGRHVRFDINLRAAANASLTMSARLLKVARTVQR